jgi:hypothetical protein
MHKVKIPMEIPLRKVLASVLAAVLALSAPAYAADAEVTVNPTFLTGHYQWTGGMPGRFVFAWDVFELNGTVMVCGAYSVTNAQLRQPVRNMLRNGGVLVDDSMAIAGLQFFNLVGRVHDEERMVGKTASCASLPSNLANGANISLDFGSGQFRN